MYSISTFKGDSGGVGWIGTLKSMIFIFSMIDSFFSVR
jgi:hypothetical protein